MQNIKSRSVSAQLMRIVFALYCVVAVVVTSVHIVEEYSHTQETIQEELKSCEAIFGDILGKALWDLDREHIRDTLSSVLEMPVVVGVEVQGEDNVTIDSLGTLPGDDSLTPGTNLVKYRFPVTYQYQENTITMGEATVYSSASIVLNRVELGFTFLIINAFIKGIALWIIFLWISNRILAKPLSKLTNEVDNLKFETLKPLSIRTDKSRPNEIDALAESFSNMVNELISSKESIVEFNRTLEKQVEDRTQDLLESKHVAESALKIKSEFLATMSHEIRTPMNGVIGMLNLLSKTHMDSKQCNYLEMARSSAEGLLVIINDILDFSKIEAGKVKLEKTNFEIFPLIHSLMHVMVVKSAQKNIDLILDTTKLDHGALIGDPHRIRQIITNITDNAIKFTAKGQVVVSFTSLQDENNPSQIQFTCEIKDSGIGIPEDKLEPLFENFNQVDSSTTRRYGGTGLGLAISKRLAELMGGKISVTSTEQVGSAFTLTLPLNIAPWAEFAQPKLENKSVALVFQNPLQLNVLTQPLIDLGAQLFTASSLDELKQALSMNTASTLDYLILETQDQHVGAQTVERVLAEPVFSNAEIIITSLADEELSEHILQKGNITQTLLTPISHLDVLHALWRLQNPDQHVESKRTTQATVRLPSTQHLSILLVEDNFINQQVVIELLQDLGHKVETADNGEIATNILASPENYEKFDLILMDCHMPVMDGYQATEAIRNGQNGLAAYQAVPIIAMTANTLEGDKEKCLAAGMNDYLPKPVVADDLLKLLSRYSHHSE